MSSEQEWEWAVFEQISWRKSEICGRPHFSRDTARAFLDYLKEQEPQRKLVLRRRKVGRWEAP